MVSFDSIDDLGSRVQADVSFHIGLFDKALHQCIFRLIEMFVIYFNSIIQIAINKRVNNSLEYRGILASFVLGILLLFPNVRRQFTIYLQSRSGVTLP